MRKAAATMVLASANAAEETRTPVKDANADHIKTVAEKPQITPEAGFLNFADEALKSGMEVSAQVTNTAGSTLIMTGSRRWPL